MHSYFENGFRDGLNGSPFDDIAANHPTFGYAYERGFNRGCESAEASAADDEGDFSDYE